MTLTRRSILLVQKLVNSLGVLKFVESSVTKRIKLPDGSSPPPVIILGPPRSGTTLFYEALAAKYHVAYLCNFAALLHSSPVTATLMAKHIGGEHKPKFESDIGFINGLYAPSEAGKLFERWFKSPDHPTVRTQIETLSAVMEGPVILKNLYFHDRIDNIDRQLPDAIFIRIKRDMVDVIYSTLEVRRKIHGDTNSWWGPTPLGWEKLQQLEPELQVAGQVYLIERAVDGLIHSRKWGGRTFSTDYEGFCDDPADNLHQFMEFYLDKTGIELVARDRQLGRFEISKHKFDGATSKKISDFLVHAEGWL